MAPPCLGMGARFDRHNGKSHNSPRVAIQPLARRRWSILPHTAALTPDLHLVDLHQELPRSPPRARLARSASGWKVMLSPGHRVVGLRKTDGMPHQRARSTHGPSSSRRIPRHIEKPGQVARAFLVVNLGAPLRWRLGGKPGVDELAYKPDPVAAQAHDQLRAACYWRADY